MVLPLVVGALINLNGKQHYIQWGVIQITVANAVIIALMIVVFIVALALPFPSHDRRRS